MTLMMSETTDPWGLPWPEDPEAPAAWLANPEGPEILPAFSGPRDDLAPLTRAQVEDLFRIHKFDYVC